MKNSKGEEFMVRSENVDKSLIYGDEVRLRCSNVSLISTACASRSWDGFLLPHFTTLIS